jgi:hypothetical protein
MFVIKNIGVEKIKASDFHNEYESYCSDHNITKIKSKIDFNTSLKNIGFNYYKSNGVNFYKISKNELKTISDKFHWVHDLDEIEQPIQSTSIQTTNKPKSKLDEGISLDDEDITIDLETLPQSKSKSKVKVVKKECPKITEEETSELYNML